MDGWIALDIGGTWTRGALFLESADTPQKILKIPTKDTLPLLDRIIHLINDLWLKDCQIQGLGIACPGPLNSFTGVVISPPNIPEWSNLPLVDILSISFNIPVALGNDANLAALGEWQFGAGRGHKNLVYLTVSTGIGGGVILDNCLMLGENGMAAELGHVTVIPAGPLCPCGQRGHLEAVASGPAIINFVNNEIKKGVPSQLDGENCITGEQITRAAQSGDPLAIHAYRLAGKYIGQALADYVHIFNPSIIILGGGVMQSGDHILDPIKETLFEKALSPLYTQNLTLSKSQLGDQSGLFGAFQWIKDKDNRSTTKAGHYAS